MILNSTNCKARKIPINQLHQSEFKIRNYGSKQVKHKKQNFYQPLLYTAIKGNNQF